MLKPESHKYLRPQICVISNASLFAGIPVKYSCSTSYVEIDLWGHSGNVWTTGSSNFGRVKLQAPKRQKLQASIFFAKCPLNLTPMDNLETNIRRRSYFAEILCEM